MPRIYYRRFRLKNKRITINLVRHLEMRYGQSHLEHVYHSQLKNRYQKSNESLQEFEADIARLVRLAYSSTPENVMERLVVQAFLDDLRDTETRQALTLARPSKLVDALARALELKAARQSCRSQAKVRKMEEDVEEGTCNEAEIRRVVEGMLEKRQIRCWNCDKGAIVNLKKQAPKKIARVASLQHPSNSVFVDGLVDEKERLLVLDPGATRTIIRPDIVGKRQELLRPASDYVLQLEIPLPFAVAEIEDELILGMDIMNTKGFELDFKNNVLKINGEEIILHLKMEETIRVVLAEDTAVPERSEMILDAHLAGNPCVGNIMVFEPRSHDGELARGIAVGKALLLTEKTVPVRIMNLNHHPVNLRKEIVLGYFSSVSSVIRKLDAQENSVRKITGELANLLSSSSRSLRSDQTTKLRSLITNDGLLKRVLEKSDGTEERKQLIVPRNRVPEVLEEIHNGSTGVTTPRSNEDAGKTYRSPIHETTGQTPASIVIGHELRLPYDLKFGCTPGDDVVYRIQKLPRGKPRVVHFNRLAPFAGNNDEQAEARVPHVSPPDGELSFEEFISLHSNGQKARYAELRMSQGIALTFKKAFGQLEELRRQRPKVGRVLQIKVAQQEKERSLFYLVTKQLSYHKPTYQTVWETVVELRDVLLSQSISSLAIPKMASGLDGLD
ncbi:hypothetical protein NQ318_009544 [Aromia moschata]|uniref:Integrase p58-like C-terminal domain-containing protein n=1 Tax=Aromia moschata TaxID=1265417 RepID=A0AAV8Y9J2_9CUCU|nr:hypothetical protein NQ318_009544 [Aromia moschata]